MDALEVYRSPSAKVEPSRWTGREAGREDNIDRAPVNDGYRRRSPGKNSRWLLVAHSYHLNIDHVCHFFSELWKYNLVLMKTAQHSLLNPLRLLCFCGNPESFHTKI